MRDAAKRTPPPVDALRRLFEYLRHLEYRWEPLTPDELLKQRRAPESYSPLLQRLGLGLPVNDELLLADGIPPEALPALAGNSESPVISRLSELFVLHDRWPPPAGQAEDYAHFGPESLTLGQYLRERIPRDGPALRVLDLGSASGGLALQWLEYQPQSTITGLELSRGAVALGQASAQAQSIPPERFTLQQLRIEPTTRLPSLQNADLVLFNPPMVHPEPGVDWPHRDGGRFGIELPLLFLQFATRHLKPGGQVGCLITNPLVHGRGLFWDELKQTQPQWRILDRQLLTPVFNQAAARKRHHAQDHIQQIELWAAHLELKG